MEGGGPSEASGRGWNQQPQMSPPMSGEQLAVRGSPPPPIRVGGGASASWPGADILVVAGAGTSLYPQVTHDDRGGEPEKMPPLPPRELW